jgi:hypothetical protein
VSCLGRPDVWLHVTRAALLFLASLAVCTRCFYRHMLPRLFDSADASSTARLVQGTKANIWESVGSKKNTGRGLNMSLSHS